MFTHFETRLIHNVAYPTVPLFWSCSAVCSTWSPGYALNWSRSTSSWAYSTSHSGDPPTNPSPWRLSPSWMSSSTFRSHCPLQALWWVALAASWSSTTTIGGRARCTATSSGSSCASTPPSIPASWCRSQRCWKASWICYTAAPQNVSQMVKVLPSCDR